MAQPSDGDGGVEVLQYLKTTDPALWLAPSQSLSQSARSASCHLFASIRPYSICPLDRLLTDGFDAEQIWQQIDLQTRPLLSTIAREIKRFEESPGEISEFFRVHGLGLATQPKDLNVACDGVDIDSAEIEEDGEGDGEEDEEESVEIEAGEEDDGMEILDEGVENDGGIEDRFLKIKDLEKYLEEDEAREYGSNTRLGVGNKDKEVGDSDDEDEDEEELDLFTNFNDETEDTLKLENARYEDFFCSDIKKNSEQSNQTHVSTDDKTTTSENGRLSTHEKQLQRFESEVKKMEKANLETKHWTMEGEVTAIKRPKNSALEVDLDFEHNVRPVPMITEDVNKYLEDLVAQRIIEGRFDDVEIVPRLPSGAPKAVKKLDDEKSKKGLAEIYEEEYVQKTSFTPSLTAADPELLDRLIKIKNWLFPRLDSLSHLQYAPKPALRERSPPPPGIPALAMEEITPMAVSDAALLAPEELYAGKGGDIKAEAELTKGDRKRRRAHNKRKYKKEAPKRSKSVEE